MPDREKVIQAMEWCQENACEGCPYDTHNNESCGISDDILTLLKEQEEKTAIDIQLSKDGFIFGGCPKCKALITHADHKNYCGYCGQAVKWE